MPEQARETPARLIVGAVSIYEDAGRLWWTSGMAVDADGCPTAYCAPGATRDGKLLEPRDYLRSAGTPGDWYGLVTASGAPSGVPVVQGPTDPAPGYYVSSTALADRSRALRNPARYVDSLQVPYIAIPPELRSLGAALGDVCHVAYRDQWSPAIVADVGPRGHIGEGSIALAAALGMDPSPKHGGCGAGVTFTIYLGTKSDPAWPRTADSILAQVVRLSGAAPVCKV